MTKSCQVLRRTGKSTGQYKRWFNVRSLDVEIAKGLMRLKLKHGRNNIMKIFWLMCWMILINPKLANAKLEESLKWKSSHMHIIKEPVMKVGVVLFLEG